MNDLRLYRARLATRVFTTLIAGIFLALAFLPTYAGEGRFLEQDEASLLQIRASGFRKDLATDEFVQVLTLKNAGKRPLIGPILVVLEGLDQSVVMRGVTRRGRTRLTEQNAFVLEPESTTGIPPGEEINLQVRFESNQHRLLNYKPRISMVR